MGVRSKRRRLAVAGLLAGLAIGAAVGATSLTGATGEDPPGARPVVLHLAKVLADPGADLELTAGVFCPSAGAEACDVQRAVAHVLPAGSQGWTDVVGEPNGPGFRFVVPGVLVGDGGFSYWLELLDRVGAAVRLPEGGPATPFRVVTTAGLREATWPGRFDWADLRESDSTVARLGYGEGQAQVGRVGGVGEEQPLGPSSFDVAPNGSLYLVDWVHGRVMVLSDTGAFRRAVPLPVERPVDLAVGPAGELAVTTLGLGATAFELNEDGRVIGRYAVAAGVAERIALTPAGPQVWVGPAQWSSVRSMPGVALPAEAQARAVAPAVPASDGTVALSQDLTGGRVAFVWARPDGSRAGAVLTLPAGVQAGVDYFVRGLPDGGAVAARGLWAEGSEAVGLLRFASDGSLASASLIPAPSHEMDAAASAVRFRAPDEVLVFSTGPGGIRIDRFEVKP
jgi:hypothetical protein